MLTKEQFEQKFMELYETGISTTEICNLLGEKRSRGYGLLRRKGMKSNSFTSKIYTKEVIDKLAQEYLQGATIEELQQKYPKYKGNINSYLRKRGITRRRGNVSNCNPKYFSKIDEPQKAYFLGLLFADGSIVEKKRNPNNKTLRLELQIQDKYIVEEFARVIGSTKEVKESFGNGKEYLVNGKTYKNNKHECYFSISNIQLIQDLINYGCTPRKSFTLVKLPNIPNEFYKDFILGFYDGDGIASVGKFRHYMGFVGTQKFLTEIANKINEEIGLPVPNLTYNQSNKMYYLCYHTNEAQIALWNYFYSNTNYPYLLRKKVKMQKALNL